MKTLFLLLGALLCLSACESDPPTDPNTNSQTHWLRDCAVDSDCQGEFSCFCGVCTVTCEGGNTCEGLGEEAVCEMSGVSIFATQCNDTPADQGLCLREELEPEPDTPSQICGTRGSLPCAETEYCFFDLSDICGAADAPGVCRAIPEGCADTVTEVCGCDNLTYPNACMAALEGVSVSQEGPCQPSESACMSNDTCGEAQYCDFQETNACGLLFDQPGTCQDRPEACSQEAFPVCGCDGVTYGNPCVAANVGVNVQAEGACVEEVTCGGFVGDTCEADEYCDFPLSEICGRADGTGVCRTRPEACDLNIDPVCGCDGTTYNNSCEAFSAGVGVLMLGACP